MGRVEKTVLRGILEPDTRLEFWPEESGEYDSGGVRLAPLPTGGSLPGVPQPTQDTEMILQAGGSQSANKALRVLTQAGGFADRQGATYLWKYEDDDYWRGCDAPNLLVAWELVKWTNSSSVAYQFPHAVTLTDDTVIAVSQSGQSPPSVRGQVRDPDAGTWSSVNIHALDTQTQEVHPCLLQLPSGRLLCYFWVEDTDQDTATVFLRYSDDGGGTWTLASQSVLPDVWSTASGSTGYDTRRLRAKYKDGQIMLVAWLTSHDTGDDTQDILVQYASSDLGQHFAEVARHDKTLTSGDQEGGAYQDLEVTDGYFVLAYLDLVTGTPIVVRMSNAYESFRTHTSYDASAGTEAWGIITGGQSYFSDGDLALWRDEPGNLYLTGRQPTVNQAWIVVRSADAGKTWEGMARSSLTGGVGKWWDAGDSSTYPKDACATWQRGRALIIHGHASSPGAYDESISCSYLGGFSTVTMPSYEARSDLSLQVTWGVTYMPFDEPDDVGWTKGTVGSTTASISSGVLNTTAAALGSLTYTLGVETLDQQILAMAVCHVESGQGEFTVQISDGASGYRVRCAITDTTVEVWDDVADAQVDSTWNYVGDAVQILVALEGNAVQVWARVYSNSHDRAWTVIATEPGLDVDGIADNEIRIVTTASSEVDWRMVCAVTDEGTTTPYAGTGLYNQQNPGGLIGRPYASVMQYVDDGLTIKAVDGPTFPGDTWNIDSRYTYDVDNLLPHLEPSRTKVWRSSAITGLDASTTTIRLAWRLDRDGAGDYLDEDCRIENDVLGLYLDGLNFSSAAVSLYYGAAWNDVDSTGVSEFQGRRYGNVIRPYDSSSGVKWRMDEAVGCGIAMINGASVSWKGVVEENTEGATFTQTLGTTKVATFRTADADAASSTATRTFRIWPRRHLLVIHPANFSRTIQGIRLEITVPSGGGLPGKPAAGYYELATVAFGPLHIFGADYAWDRTIQVVPNVETSRAPDGSRQTRVLGPALETLEVNWADGVDVSGQRLTAPDYITGSAASDAEPVSFAYDAPEKLQDLVRRLDGPDRVIVYVPVIDYDAEEVGYAGSYLERARGTIYGRITSPVRIEQVLGSELENEIYRVTTVEITEEP